MSTPTKNAPAAAPTATGAENNHPSPNEKESNNIMTQPKSTPHSPKLEPRRAWAAEEPAKRIEAGEVCSRCLQPADGIDWEAVQENGSGDVVAVCTECLTAGEQQAIDDADMQLADELDTTEPMTVDALLTEADALMPTLLASRLASASQCFPGPDHGTVYVQSNCNRITIAVTQRDPDTLHNVTREFTAVVHEVR